MCVCFAHSFCPWCFLCPFESFQSLERCLNHNWVWDIFVGWLLNWSWDTWKETYFTGTTHCKDLGFEIILCPLSWWDEEWITVLMNNSVCHELEREKKRGHLYMSFSIILTWIAGFYSVKQWKLERMVKHYLGLWDKVTGWLSFGLSRICWPLKQPPLFELKQIGSYPQRKQKHSNIFIFALLV